MPLFYISTNRFEIPKNSSFRNFYFQVVFNLVIKKGGKGSSTELQRTLRIREGLDGQQGKPGQGDKAPQAGPPNTVKVTPAALLA